MGEALRGCAMMTSHPQRPRSTGLALGLARQGSGMTTACEQGRGSGRTAPVSREGKREL